MSNHNLPRRPVRFQEHNRNLLDSMGASYDLVEKSHPDYVNDTTVGTLPPGVQPSYRTPPDRVSGNKMFRRYLNGILDLEYACHKVIDALHKVRANAAPLAPQDLMALQAIFPGNFNTGVDPAMAMATASVQLELLPSEVMAIRAKVAAHFAEELNYNAGYGGGSVPGRSVTYEG